MRTLLLLVCVSTSLFGAQALRVVPVRPTPESETVQLRVVFPKEYENKRRQPTNIQLRIEGFPLGTISQFDRKNQIYGDPLGQSIHFIIDDRPYLAYYQSVEDSFDQNRIFYDRILSFDLPFKLSGGQHVIRTFPCRSYGESLKNPGAYTSSVFYLHDKKRVNDLDVNLDKPYLTYNEPQGSYPISQANPILLDFYLTNVQLSQDGYKVRLSVNGKVERLLTQWVPYYLYGLSPGRHIVRLELVDKNNKRVSGLFNDVKREIKIE